MALFVFPFVLGLGLLALQPIVDKACTKHLEDNGISGRALAGAAWASVVSSFLPNAVLTTFGAFAIVLDADTTMGDWVLIATVVIYTASFMFFLHEVTHGIPSRKIETRIGLRIPKTRIEIKSRTVPYGRLQVGLAFLNILGIVLAISFHLTETTGEETDQVEHQSSAHVACGRAVGAPCSLSN